MNKAFHSDLLTHLQHWGKYFFRLHFGDHWSEPLVSSSWPCSVFYQLYINLCFNKVDSNGLSISNFFYQASANEQSLYLLCWTRERTKTCRIAALEDSLWSPLDKLNKFSVQQHQNLNSVFKDDCTWICGKHWPSKLHTSLVTEWLYW